MDAKQFHVVHGLALCFDFLNAIVAHVSRIVDLGGYRINMEFSVVDWNKKFHGIAEKRRDVGY
ncbi:hypothetical protein Ptc2401_01344 [Prosthecochloris sp. CIB 2401]|nr:hypothetical protein Ptc2401_01344 [Prosthecochloris sp. CIB 2401]